MERDIDEIIDCVIKFKNNSKDNNSNLQWEYCYKVFYKARQKEQVDVDFLSLHLAFYLASWGMYRGSSFLREYDHKVHTNVIEEILNDEYDSLLGICMENYDEENINRLMELKNNIADYYTDKRKAVEKQMKRKNPVKSPISQILITKILLGTLGCVPAYDRYFERGIKEYKSDFDHFSCNKKSIEELKVFYSKYKDRFEEQRHAMKIKDTDIEYPPMKVLDMGFWQLGYNLEKPDN